MKLSLIVAVSENNVIGLKNALPWKVRKESEYFRTVTAKKPVIMGRNTHHSIGRLLPDRLNIVLTSKPEEVREGAETVQELQRAIVLAEESGAEEAFIIGGAPLYELALPVVDTMYFTRMHLQVKFMNPEDVVFFPAVDWQEWKELEERRQFFPIGEDNPVAFTTHVYEHAAVAQAA